MSYLLLGLAIGAEILATTCLKYSEGLTKALPTFACVVSYILCYYCFGKAITKINLGVAYATWCGAGIVVTALISLLVFRESLSIPGVIGIVFIVAGCVLLNLF